MSMPNADDGLKMVEGNAATTKFRDSVEIISEGLRKALDEALRTQKSLLEDIAAKSELVPLACDLQKAYCSRR
jgi:hypothetical protein